MKRQVLSVVCNYCFIYTLAESGTTENSKKSDTILVTGKGTDINDNPSLINRAKRKTISRKMILSLIDVANKKGDTERVKSYWNSYYCQKNIIISGDKLYSNYCKNRFCTICSAIRKAEIINKYYPIISKWKDIQFLTLTVKSISKRSLKKWISYCLKKTNTYFMTNCQIHCTRISKKLITFEKTIYLKRFR